MRNNMIDWIKSERAIYEAKQVIEREGAHPLLTEATILLTQAQGKVAEWVELTTEALKEK